MKTGKKNPKQKIVYRDAEGDIYDKPPTQKNAKQLTRQDVEKFISRKITLVMVDER